MNDLRFLTLEYPDGPNDKARRPARLTVSTPGGRVREIPLSDSELLALIRRAAAALERTR